jgi:hypothetical protein
MKKFTGKRAKRGGKEANLSDGVKMFKIIQKKF